MIHNWLSTRHIVLQYLLSEAERLSLNQSINEKPNSQI